MVDMPGLTEFEKEFYKWEGKYELMDPDKFYDDIHDEKNVENVQKPS